MSYTEFESKKETLMNALVDEATTKVVLEYYKFADPIPGKLYYFGNNKEKLYLYLGKIAQERYQGFLYENEEYVVSKHCFLNGKKIFRFGILELEFKRPTLVE